MTPHPALNACRWHVGSRVGVQQASLKQTRPGLQMVSTVVQVPSTHSCPYGTPLTQTTSGEQSPQIVPQPSSPHAFVAAHWGRQGAVQTPL